MPAIAAFWVSSKLARPLTISTCPDSGSRPARTPSPMTLSTALCRPDVLAQGDQLPRGGEQPRGVQPAGLLEHLLLRAQPVRQREQHLQRQPGVVGGDVERRLRADRVDAGLAADAAGARGVEVPVQRGVRGLDARRQVDVDDVVGVAAVGVDGVAVPQAEHVVGAGDDALGGEEAVHEVEVVPGRAHRDRERRAARAGSPAAPRRRPCRAGCCARVRGCAAPVSGW